MTECRTLVTISDMLNNRRAAPRFRAYRPVRVQKPGSIQLVETLTKDLSTGGMRFLSPTIFPVSTDLQVELVLSTGGEPFSVRGRAAWVQMIPHSDQFDIGISFQDVSIPNQRRLSAYIARLASHPDKVTA